MMSSPYSENKELPCLLDTKYNNSEYFDRIHFNNIPINENIQRQKDIEELQELIRKTEIELNYKKTFPDREQHGYPVEVLERNLKNYHKKLDNVGNDEKFIERIYKKQRDYFEQFHYKTHIPVNGKLYHYRTKTKTESFSIRGFKTSLIDAYTWILEEKKGIITINKNASFFKKWRMDPYKRCYENASEVALYAPLPV